jgi:hypothetical protein
MTTDTSIVASGRKRRWPIVLIGILIAIVILVIAFFVVDARLRVYAEGQVSDQVSANLPKSASGDVGVTIGGASTIVQYLTGSFQRVTLDAPHLTVNGTPVSADIVATDVPTDLSKPVGNLKGTINLTQSALNSLVTVPGSTGGLVLGSGTIKYNGSISVLGIPIGYEVTVKPVAHGDSVLLTPTSAKVTSGSFGFDLSKTLSDALGAKPVSVCVAQYLPRGVSVTDVAIAPGKATVVLDAPNLVLSEKSLNTKGSCSQ